MNNTEILKNRWQNIDKEIEKFGKSFKYDVKTRINGYIKAFSITSDNLYSYMKKNDLEAFKNEIEDIIDVANDYFKYKLNQYLKRTKIKYIDALKILVELAYYKMFEKNKKFEDELFNNVTRITNEQVQEESYNIKFRFKRFHVIPFPNYLIPYFMSLPLYLGYDWLEYKRSIIDYNANKTYRKIVVDLQQQRLDLDTYENSFKLERKRYVTALDNEVATLCNEVSLWGMKQQGIKKVQFIAVMDEKTTNICQSMDRQIFDIEKVNVYYRYAENNDERMTKYVTKGLEVGQNMPALHYNCRSVIYPYK